MFGLPIISMVRSCVLAIAPGISMGPCSLATMEVVFVYDGNFVIVYMLVDVKGWNSLLVDLFWCSYLSEFGIGSLMISSGVLMFLDFRFSEGGCDLRLGFLGFGWI